MDRIVGLSDVRVDIAMVRTSDGHSRLELTRFHTPAATDAPANTLAIRRIMFAVDDIGMLDGSPGASEEQVAEVAQVDSAAVGVEQAGGGGERRFALVLGQCAMGGRRGEKIQIALGVIVHILPEADRA